MAQLHPRKKEGLCSNSMKQKNVFYFDKEFEEYDKKKQEEKELANAKRLMGSKNLKLRKVGEFKFALLTGQLDELNNRHI